MKKLMTIISLVLAVVCLSSCEGLESPNLTLAEPWCYEGEYDDSAIYHSTEDCISVVFFINAYYVAREEAPDNFQGVIPTDRDYWQILSGRSIAEPKTTNHQDKRGRLPY